MRVPGFDPHIDIAILSGLMTKEEADRYKELDKMKDRNTFQNEEYLALKDIRSDAKTINFAGIYGAAAAKIAETLKKPLEFATILYYIGTNNYKKQNYIVSNRKGLTEDELGYKIMEKFLKGEELSKISKDLQLNKNQTSRSFHRFIRKHIEINDFNGIFKE